MIPKTFHEELAGDFNAKVEREDIFKPTTGNENIRQDTNDNGVRTVNLATSINLFVNSMMFPHRNFHKYTWNSPDGKTHNQIIHVLIDRRWHSSILGARSFRRDDCDTDHSLGFTKVTDRLAVSTQTSQNFDAEGFYFGKLSWSSLRNINSSCNSG
jgi:hypothetical protein